MDLFTRFSTRGPVGASTPVPGRARVAQVRTPSGPLTLVGDLTDLAVLGVLCRWPSPGFEEPAAA